MADEDPKPDQTPDPEVETTPDQTASPAGGEAEAKAEETKQPEDEPLRFTQATFTKLTQELAEERRARQAYEAKLDEVLSTRRATEPPPEEEPPENPVVEKALRSSKFGREAVQKIAGLEQALRSVSEIAVTQGLAAQYPELAGEIPQFIGWVKSVPGRAGAIQSGHMGSDKEIVAAYRAVYPAKVRASAGTKPATPKASPRVEGASAPRGSGRDIRTKIQETRPETMKGRSRISIDDAFEVALPEARREVKLAEE